MTKLQLALDVLTTKQALEIATLTADYIDIIEIGTPLIKHEGLCVVKTMRENFMDKEILVDLKTMDVGEYESDYCFEAGADIVTVLGVADIETIKGSIKSAQKFGKKVMVDMINVKDKVTLANTVHALGADYVGIHSGIDQQNKGETPLADLQKVKSKSEIAIIVAGGINTNTIDAILTESPDVIVVGGAITGASDPASTAAILKEKISIHNKKPQQPKHSITNEYFMKNRLMQMIQTSLDNGSQNEFHNLVNIFTNTQKRIFVAGSGRSGLVGKFFAMRLMHLGYVTYIAEETNTPAIASNDLLIAISASGKTQTVINALHNAKTVGATTLCISANQTSPLFELCDQQILIDSRNHQKRLPNESHNRSIPMGTSFELSTLVYLEALICELMSVLQITEEEMKKNHANL